MKQVVFAVPGDLATATGGFVYDRRIVAELPKSGWQVDVLDIGTSTRPAGSAASCRCAVARSATLARGKLVPISSTSTCQPDFGSSATMRRS